MTTPFLTPMTPSSPAPLLINYSSYDHIDPNPNSSTAQDQHLPPFSLHHFPSPFLDDNQLFLNHLMADDDHVCAPDESNHDETNNMGQTSTVATEHDHPTSSSKLARKKTMTTKGATSKQQRRSGKKDRHSKIYTAQGLRDRRMRLSLQIARKFFDLQDMLGFDKASKTIDWLFSKSKKAIKQLSCTTTNHLQVPQIKMITGAKSQSSMSSSECEEESDDEIKKAITASEGESRQTVKSRTSSYSNPIVRETRDRARARARERTREKRMIRCLEKSKPYLSDQTSTSYIFAQLGSAASNPNSIFEIKGQGLSMSCPSQERANSPRECSSIIQSSSLHQEMVNLGIIEKFLGAYASSSSSSSSSSSCSIFDYQKNDTLFSSGLYSYPNKFLGFPEYWDNINSNNSAMTTSMVPTLTGKTPTSGFMANYNYQHFQSHNQAD